MAVRLAFDTVTCKLQFPNDSLQTSPVNLSVAVSESEAESLQDLVGFSQGLLQSLTFFTIVYAGL